MSVATSNKHPIDLSKKCYIVITGASRGIGQTLAIEFAKLVASDSIIVLIARSEKGLNETKAQMVAINPNISVNCAPYDLSKPSAQDFKEIIQKSLVTEDITSFDIAIAVHNAASEGDVTKKASELNDLKIWQDYFALNLFGCAILNSEFITCFNKTHNVSGETKKMVLINLDSLLGSVPMKSFTYYSTGKASRTMFFKVLALEEPNILVLNYSPGPVATAMTDGLVKNIGDPDSRKTFVALQENAGVEGKGFLSTHTTIAKLLKVLKEGNYESGQYVDYFD